MNLEPKEDILPTARSLRCYDASVSYCSAEFSKCAHLEGRSTACLGTTTTFLPRVPEVFFSVSLEGKKTTGKGGQLTDRAAPIGFKDGQNLTLVPDWRNRDNTPVIG